MCIVCLCSLQRNETDNIHNDIYIICMRDVKGGEGYFFNVTMTLSVQFLFGDSHRLFNKYSATTKSPNYTKVLLTLLAAAYHTIFAALLPELLVY